MLYDNALLAQAYARAARVTGERPTPTSRRGVLAWVERELTRSRRRATPPASTRTRRARRASPTRGRSTSSAPVLPRRSVELRHRALRPRRRGGNFRDEATGQPPGRNILHLPRPLPVFARSGWSAPLGADDVLLALAGAATDRPQPGLDDKVITAWNGLLLSAFAYAGTALEDEGYLDRGRELADFLLAALPAGGRHAAALPPRQRNRDRPGSPTTTCTSPKGCSTSPRRPGKRGAPTRLETWATASSRTSRTSSRRVLVHVRGLPRDPLRPPEGDLRRSHPVRERDRGPRSCCASGPARATRASGEAADRALLDAWRPLLGMARAARAPWRSTAPWPTGVRLGDAAGARAGARPTPWCGPRRLRVDAYLERDRLGPGLRVRFALRVTCRRRAGT